MAPELVVTALNDAHGTSFEPSFFKALGRETLEMEWEFNRQAGFTEDDDELPAFFWDEPLAPSNKVQRHRSADVNKALRELLAQQPGVQMSSNGSYRSNTGILLRGASATQIILLVDGVRVGSATNGSLSLETIPLESIERIE